DRQTVLGHTERRPVRAHARAEIGHLGNRHAGIVGDHHGTGLRKDAVQVFDDFRFLGFFHFALLTSARVTIRVPTLLLFTLPQGQNPNRRSFPRKSGSFPVCAGNLLSLFRAPAVSDSPGDRPPEFSYATPPAPTAASEIFTPGPMVEEMEIFS